MRQLMPRPWLILLFLLFVPCAEAQENVAAQPPTKYEMKLVYIFEGEATEFLFVVGDAGFKSVDSLKRFLNTLPPETILEWAPGCRRTGKEPLLSSESEMEAFKAFCLERNLKFVLIPSG